MTTVFHLDEFTRVVCVKCDGCDTETPLDGYGNWDSSGWKVDVKDVQYCPACVERLVKDGWL